MNHTDRRIRRALDNAQRCFGVAFAGIITALLDPYLPTLLDLI